ncbi:hypothetical protein [Candidatus Pandoraea novymonadis]|uniref:Uncharacterized protein n=1 Tax=Candidatus Pandoraea novymonadis TaxID=1808959 RepID=A0ABX5FEY5_9BURK|nr:hypothetical protein [Candidatus Pandoraea novymonadis]PSB92254.1 hypothetical protein BZL35_00490 [Candidatus Pandoraea novymonadis]
MKKSILVASLLAIALTACGKKEGSTTVDADTVASAPAAAADFIASAAEAAVSNVEGAVSNIEAAAASK